MNRTETLQRLRKKIAAGNPIVARFLKPSAPVESSTTDLLALYHTAQFQNSELIAGLLPFGNANEIIKDLARSVFPGLDEVPVLAGVSSADPFRLIRIFLKELQAIGFVGIQNFPSVGIIDGPFRVHLESKSSGYNKEVETIRLAHELDLLTAPLVFNATEATDMINAGADILVINPPLQPFSPTRGKHAPPGDAIVSHLGSIIETARSLRDDIILLYNSYRPADLDTAASLLQACPGLNGYWIAPVSELKTT
jgi:predicted TIM-barrel enzyme